jgi:hypothetical protein
MKKSSNILIRKNDKHNAQSHTSVNIVACLDTETRSSEFWLVLFKSSPVVTTCNDYTFKIAVIIAHRAFNSLLLQDFWH